MNAATMPNVMRSCTHRMPYTLRTKPWRMDVSTISKFHPVVSNGFAEGDTIYLTAQQLYDKGEVGGGSSAPKAAKKETGGDLQFVTFKLAPTSDTMNKEALKGEVEGRVKKALAVKLSGHKSVDQSVEAEQVTLTMLPDGKVRTGTDA